MQRVREIRYELIQSSDTADFENSYKHLNKNLRKSLDVLHGPPLEINDLNDTQDLVIAHDKIRKQI